MGEHKLPRRPKPQFVDVQVHKLPVEEALMSSGGSSAATKLLLDDMEEGHPVECLFCKGRISAARPFGEVIFMQCVDFPEHRWVSPICGECGRAPDYDARLDVVMARIGRRGITSRSETDLASYRTAGRH